MFKDTQIMITMQLALIGIVLIAGLYLVWKALGRIEEKVDLLLLDKQTHTLFSGKPSDEKKAKMMDPQNLMADTLMQSIFQEDLENDKQDGFVIFSSPFTVDDTQGKNETSKDVIIEDVTTSINEAREPSESMTTTPSLSKSKLHKMNLDKLKELCKERHLSTEGTKQQLIEQLLED
uniref:SAP domain-containing protein n=1 Tax=viral metagenome TaxID=1070528 RepID=A0A6C0CRQ8_9ZZZZ